MKVINFQSNIFISYDTLFLHSVTGRERESNISAVGCVAKAYLAMLFNHSVWKKVSR
jgi:hypothetical protein